MRGTGSRAKNPRHGRLDEILVQVLSKADIEENNLYLAASLAHLFVVLCPLLLGAIRMEIGAAQVLFAAIVVLVVRDNRKGIRREYEEWIRELQNSR